LNNTVKFQIKILNGCSENRKKLWGATFLPHPVHALTTLKFYSGYQNTFKIQGIHHGIFKSVDPLSTKVYKIKCLKTTQLLWGLHKADISQICWDSRTSSVFV